MTDAKLVRTELLLRRIGVGTFCDPKGTTTVRIPIFVDRDLGEPEAITVTIAPGDLLNV